MSHSTSKKNNKTIIIQNIEINCFQNLADWYQ